MAVGNSPGGSDGKETAFNAGDLGLIPELERSPGEEMLTHCSGSSWLGNPMGRGTWWATVHGISESDTIERLTFFNIAVK